MEFGFLGGGVWVVRRLGVCELGMGEGVLDWDGDVVL